MSASSSSSSSESTQQCSKHDGGRKPMKEGSHDKYHKHKWKKHTKRGMAYSNNTGRYDHQKTHQGANGQGHSRWQLQGHHCRKKGRRQRRGLMPHQNANQQDDTATEASDSSLEIPGFYYDAEKKKYFRIVESHNQVSGVVTKETIEKKNAESVRLKKVKEMCAPKKKSNSSSTSQTYRHPYEIPRKVKCFQNLTNLCDLIEFNRLGLTRCNQVYSWRSKCIENRIENFKPRGILNPRLTQINGHPVQHCQQMAALHGGDGTRLLTLWTADDDWGHCIQILHVRSIQNKDEDGSVALDVEEIGHRMDYQRFRFTNLCWAPSDATEEYNALYVMSPCMPGFFPTDTTSLAFLNMNLCAAIPRIHSYSLGPHVAWACAWDRANSRFSVGLDTHGLVIDVESGRHSQLHSKNKDVYTQDFASQGDNLLFSGTKAGKVLAHDLRSLSTRATFSLEHKSCIAHVKCRDDPRYVLATDFTGRICQWDIRNRKVILEFEGHQNSYRHNILPFGIDEDLGILYAVGQDSYSRLWDVRNGKLLKTIPPPYAASKDHVPRLAMMRPGLSPCGLLMGVRDELHFYS